jgi:hypothetical protein
MSDGTQETTDTLILAGQDRKPGEGDDDNVLSGRSTAMCGSIDIEEIVLTEADGGKADDRLTEEAYYTIKGAKSTYYVTAGLDGMLGTYDDIIKDGSGNGTLGKYDIHLTGIEDVGWMFISGNSVDNMLIATEYVLDNVVFNAADGKGIYEGSTLATKMNEIYTKMNGTLTAIKRDQTISMADYTGKVDYIWTCVTEGHTDENGYHTAISGCTADLGASANGTVEIKGQSDIQHVTFFALSIEEMAKAYNGSDSTKYRKVQYAECGTGNTKSTYDYEETTKIQSADYWLRSPGTKTTFVSRVTADGILHLVGSVSYTLVGARPACYATLA